MKSKLWKKSGALLLALAMVLAMMPQMAFAEEGTVEYLYYDESKQEWITGIKNGDAYILVTAEESQWGENDGQEHWYVVRNEVETSTRITVTGDVHLILEDGCTLDAKEGIGVSKGNSLTIYAQSKDSDSMGKLIAEGTFSSAGIGGGSGEAGGNITISGGEVEATGNSGGAGIGGGGNGGAGGNITINGGTVEATGSEGGAGIGGGIYGAGGNITISGGTVEAKSEGGAQAQGGAGIGGGISRAGGNITISGGTVKATGSEGGAGIGGGSGGAGGVITISGGTVEATGSYGGAGIGGGDGEAGGEIKITGSEVTATGAGVAQDGGGGAGIGGGYCGAGGKIEISGSTVTATGGETGGAGIGRGTIASTDTESFIAIDNAIIFVESTEEETISAGTDNVQNSVIFEKKGEMPSSGQVYGDVTLKQDLTIESDMELTIPKDNTLTIPSGKKLTNEGTLTNQGTFINHGTLDNSNGTFNNQGIYTGNLPSVGEITKSVTVTSLEVSPKEVEQGGKITLTATVTTQSSDVPIPDIAVKFSCKDGEDNERELGTSTTETDGKATLEVTTDNSWKEGSYKFKAVFEGNAVYNKSSHEGIELTVKKKTSSGGGYIPPVIPEKPTISQGDGYKTEVDKNGNVKIKVDDDYEIEDVLVNGESRGPVDSLYGLKTGDTVEIIVISKEEKHNAYLKDCVKKTTIKAWSERTKKGIKVYFKKSYGFKVDGYEFFRSTKKGTFSKKPYYVSKKGTARYLNNTKNIKKGTHYYYKIKGFRTIGGEKVYTKWSNVANRTAR